MACSRADRQMSSGPLKAVILALALPQGASMSEELKACPVRDPYSVEDSPFGWPLTPDDWTWRRPDCWDKAHLICGGQRQSPIDIDLDLPSCPAVAARGPDGLLANPDVASYKSAASDPVHISWYMGTASVRGSFGHVELQEGKHTVTYEASQVHIAAPSLHTFKGKHYDAELMIFHKRRGAKDMLTAGVIVSMMYSHSSNASSKIFDTFGFDTTSLRGSVHLGPNWDVPRPPVDLEAEMQEALKGTSYLYNGSVPVPPCTENIKWIVLGSPQPVSPVQTQSLRRHLQYHGRDVQHRPPQKRDMHGAGKKCREIAVNSLQLGGAHEDLTCQAAKDAGHGLRSARCWDVVDPCFNKRYSAVDVLSAGSTLLEDEKTANVHHGEKIVHYKPVTTIEVSTSDFSVDASVGLDDIMLEDGHGNFGHLLLNGHIFFARSLSFKPVSQHTVNGKHFAGELQIEHVLFGDTFGQGIQGYHHSLHKVMVSVMLKLGRENTLLRALELFKNKHSIRDRVTYRLENMNFDLAKELEPALQGPWYWYSSNSTRQGCGSSVRWMVFEEPLEVNIEQLNCLALSVAGMDSSQVPRRVPKGYLWKEHLPTEAVELNETDCGTLPKVDWKYGESHPHWDHGNERCWTTGYPICGDGRRQSPIDILTGVAKVGKDSFLARCSWKPVSAVDVLNTGHNIQVNSNQFGYITYVGPDGFPEYYHVVQFHIHMPSEHMIDGKQFAAELHIVHKRQQEVGYNADDDLLVAGIMFDIGKENSTLLEQLFLPGADEVLKQQGLGPKTFLADGMVVDEADEKVRVKKPVDLMRAMGPVLDGPFYRYDGSLTTPPCSESVKWFVFGTPLKMSQKQWLSFKALYPNPENNRPIQPVNGRPISLNSMEEGEIMKYDFYLNRHTGRNRFQPAEGAILIPIIFTVVFTIFVMASLFVRESRSSRTESSGGLADQLGKPVYAHLK